jgi:RNA polymerase sigma-70 factor (ECF subfamily)
VWTELEKYRQRLVRMVSVRLDDRLRARLDASDVVQEALLDVHRRLPEYLQRRDMPFIVWVRYLTTQRLKQLHRFHLGAERRDPQREARSPVAGTPTATSMVLADCLAASGISVSEQLTRDEGVARMLRALEDLSEVDREILALRHYEQLSNQEAAEVLQLELSAASQRYLRAIQRLKAKLDG